MKRYVSKHLLLFFSVGLVIAFTLALRNNE